MKRWPLDPPFYRSQMAMQAAAGKPAYVAIGDQTFHRLCSLTIAVLCVAMLAPQSGWAQSGQPVGSWENVMKLEPGTQVLAVLSDKRTIHGPIRDVTDDSIVMSRGKMQETIVRNSVVRIAMRRKGHRMRNTLIGLGVGAGAGLTVGGIYAQTCTGFLCGIGAVVFVPIGLVGGAAIGAALPTGGWQDVYRS